ncbi:hypothetical protein EVAR_64449_1 [Eumeta japonica]|uniref:Uncharacterized protein n=1 Tax=Eumeta variegata TaxID=151549 RepID=A0A4C1YU88_EUMVA|nr:hypothetical protein EVAR_64449_1 [Eumeta japonica]
MLPQPVACMEISDRVSKAKKTYQVQHCFVRWLSDFGYLHYPTLGIRRHWFCIMFVWDHHEYLNEEIVNVDTTQKVDLAFFVVTPHLHEALDIYDNQSGL